MDKEQNYLEISIFDLLLAIAKRRKMVIWTTAIFLLLAVLYAFLAPQHWVSKVSLVPVMDEQAAMAINLNVMQMLSGGVVGTQKEEMAIEFITILDSRTFREGIIRRHNLIRYFKLTEPDTMKAMDRALQKLAAQVLRIELEVQTSVLTLTVETKDKVLSRDIAQDCLASLEDYNQHRKLTKSKLLRQFLQGRVEETRVRLDSLSAAEKQFNLKHKTVAVDLQTQDVIKLYSDLVAQKFQAEIDLALAKTTRDASSPAVKELEEKQALLAAKITDLEKSNTKLFPKYILPMDDLPSLKLQYARLLLERSTAEQIYNSIYTQFETARIEELKAMPTMEIIDRPNLAGLRAKPKRALLIGLVTFAGLLLASTLSIILEFINTEQKSRIHSILRELRFRK